jgi:two-component system OmpR family sensor kinase
LSIRWRLTLWFSLALLVILVISGSVLNAVLRGYLYNEIDNNLEIYSARVHGTLHPQATSAPLDYNMIHSSLPPINEFSSPGLYIQLLDANGKVVVKTDNLGDLELPVSPLLIEQAISGKADIQTVAAGDNAGVRIMVSPLYTRDQTLILEVAQSVKPVESALSQLRLALIAAALTALLLTGALGVILIRRALEPVEHITRAARSIEESSNLDRRVGYRGPQDEIGRLATTFRQHDRTLE